MIEDAADVGVEILDHRGVGGVLMLLIGLELRLEVLDIGGGRFDGGVRRVVGQVEEEGLLAGGVDEGSAASVSLSVR